MTALKDAAQALILELRRVEAQLSLPAKDRDGRSIFGQIKAGDDQFIRVSQPMERAIDTIARELKRNDVKLAKTHTDSEWSWMVRNALGPALAPIDLDGDLHENVKAVLSAVRTLLSQHTYGPCEHAFGCTLFGSFEIAPFEIGPVKFEPRLAWLDRKTHDGAVSQTTARRVARTWGGNKMRKRKRGLETWIESDMLAAVGECRYVCSVKTDGLAAGAGRQKALTAARLAMTAIALRWEIPSRALNGFGLGMDGGARRQCTLAFYPGKEPLGASTLHGMPHGPSIRAAEWASQLSEHRADFDIAGEAIAYFLSATGNVVRPKLMNTLSQALLWYHEACRDEFALMAVVKFSMSLDALAVGGKSGGIRRLISARLGLQDDQPIRKNGPTMKAAVEELYSDGRSRTVHGTNEKVSHDWSSTRGLGEQFGRRCLTAALDWAARNPTLDDPSQLQT